jgi:hypothetical protein
MTFNCTTPAASRFASPSTLLTPRTPCGTTTNAMVRWMRSTPRSSCQHTYVLWLPCSPGPMLWSMLALPVVCFFTSGKRGLAESLKTGSRVSNLTKPTVAVDVDLARCLFLRITRVTAQPRLSRRVSQVCLLCPSSMEAHACFSFLSLNPESCLRFRLQIE